MDPCPSHNGHQHATYPPKVSSIEVVGYVEDANEIGYSRDIGRSFTLNGRQFYIFGDTFCKDSAGNFVGLVNNTVALIPERHNPCVSKYLSFNDDDTVKCFVPLTMEEKNWQKSTGGRVTLWGFGGAVELVDGTGRIWFQKGTISAGGDNEYCGIGLAEIHYNDTCEQLTTQRLEGTLDNGLFFGTKEPKVGSFSTLIEGPFAYLWGEYNGHVVLARTRQEESSIRGLYGFWNGTDYVTDFAGAAPISAFDEIPQGQIFRSDLFGKQKRYVFVGVSKWCDSLIRVGAAERLEGPWEVWPVAMTQGINITNGFRYCIYPHLFASHTRNAELLVTWSEQWPGGVIAGKANFLTEEQPCEEYCELIN